MSVEGREGGWSRLTYCGSNELRSPAGNCREDCTNRTNRCDLDKEDSWAFTPPIPWQPSCYSPGMLHIRCKLGRQTGLTNRKENANLRERCSLYT